MKIIKRDLSEVSFDISKIENAIYKAFISVGDEDKKLLSKRLAEEVFESILQDKTENSSISVEEIQDYVEKTSASPETRSPSCILEKLFSRRDRFMKPLPACQLDPRIKNVWRLNDFIWILFASLIEIGRASCRERV